MTDNIDIEQNVDEILPRLFDKLPNNSLFIMGKWNVINEKVSVVVLFRFVAYSYD